MTRLWSNGQPIQVTLGTGDLPLAFVWQGQKHQVDDIPRRWRVDLGWWQLRVWRDYFRLSTDTGLLVEIYRDLANGGWYLQRLYD